MPGVITVAAPAAHLADPSKRTSYPLVTGLPPVPGRAYALALAHGGADGAAAALPSSFTVTTGHTFVQKATVAHSSDPNRRLTVYIAKGVASPTLGNVVANFATAQGYAIGRIIALEGVNGTNPDVQVVFASSGETKVGSFAPAGLAPWSDPNGALLEFHATSTMVHLEADNGTSISEIQLGSGKLTSLNVAFADDEHLHPSVVVRTADDTAASTTKILSVLIELRPATVVAPVTRPKVTPVWAAEYTSSSALASYTNVGDVTTPVAGDVYLLALMSGLNSGTPNDPVVTGYGETWELAAEVHWSNTPIRNLWVYRACETSGLVAGRLTVNFSGQTQTSLLAILLRVEHTADATGDEGAAAIAQALAAFHDTTNVSSYEITLADAFEVGDTNVAFAVFGAAITGSMTPATSPAPTWTELGDTTTTTAGKNAALAAYWYDGKDTSAKVNLSTAGKVAGIVFELRGVAGVTTGFTAGETIDLEDDDDEFRNVDFEHIDLIEGAGIEDSGGGPTLPSSPGPIPDRIRQLDLLVQVRDADLKIVAEVPAFDELELVPRYQATGRWRLVVDTNTRAGQLLSQRGAGIVVKLDGGVELSGPVRERTYSFDGNRDLLEVAGPDDNVWVFGDRIAHPQPQTAIPPWNLQGYDIRQGVAETVLLQYVLVNVGEGAVGVRRNEHVLLEPDQGRGANANPEGGPIIGRGRYQPLGDLAVALATSTARGLGWRVVWSSEGVLTLQIYEPVDRSSTVVFSREMGNLVAYKLRQVAPTATTLYVGGQGEEEAREVIEISDPAGTDEWGRIERFVDRRDVPLGDTAGLQQAAEQAITEARGQLSLSITPIDSPRQAYRRHWWIGDLVKVVIAGVPYVVPVREATLKFSARGGDAVQSITPTLGDQPVPLQLFARVARLEAGQSTLQRR